MKAKSIEQGAYVVEQTVTQREDELIMSTISVLTSRLKYANECMASPFAVRNFLQLKLTGLEYEVFSVIYLDSQNRMIAFEEMFRGTLNQTSVYPREVVKAALQHNAGAVIFAHNHPSGVSDPSRADEMLTRTLVDALKLVDVKVLDHFIVAGSSTPLSFAERGLI